MATTDLSGIWTEAVADYRRMIDSDSSLSARYVDFIGRLECCSDDKDLLDEIQNISKDFRIWRQGSESSQEMRNRLKAIVNGVRVAIDVVAETASALVGCSLACYASALYD